MAMTNPVVQSILSKGVATFGFLEAAAILGFKPDAAYSSRSRKDFPVRTRQRGKRLIVFTSDLVSYLQTGESQAASSVPQISRTFKVRTGRPTKRESLTAVKLGLTVKELRAMPASGLKTSVQEA